MMRYPEQVRVKVIPFPFHTFSLPYPKEVRVTFFLPRSTQYNKEEFLASSLIFAMLRKSFHALVVGAGHNGLTAATYLAKQGLSVCVVERRDKIGGAAVTEELFPGYHYSRASYLFSLFRPKVVEELELERHGLKLYPREPSSYTPTLDGRSLLMSCTGTIRPRVRP